ncbi:energy-coupling factor transporter transmembrane protein EcfT [Thalassococcus sp. S3]|uniref:energy-coupling factor transporter transmembrane component T family protein n=1 Tax=Thalassococcus sp. S3 TaxID=2017482 RepID=UPI001023FAA1|nr:energy-coupling factor transporter transmembrane protein EcfT [Thalassococcus sp. S3]QBF29651.1 cobalt ABC transporter permease [Thalassococcus sp. S3]
MFDLYREGSSFLHRLPPGVKLLSLAICGTVLFLLDSIVIMLAFLVTTVGLYLAVGFSLRTAWAQLRPAAWILAILFVAQVVLNSWETAVFIIARFAGLLLLAGLLTLTTRASDMIEAMERGFWVLRYVGVSPAKVSLALSLALRFIPVLATVTNEVREAQKVRGLDRSIIAVAIPVVVRMLRMSDDISDAIDARGYAPR